MFTRTRKETPEDKDGVPLYVMLAQATTQVWTTAFSWRVKGRCGTPIWPSRPVHALRRKKPSSAAKMLSEGMIPDVNTRFIMTPLSATPSARLTATARAVTCSGHGGMGFTSNTRSVDGHSRGSPIDSILLLPLRVASLPDGRCEWVTANAYACRFDSRAAPAVDWRPGKE